MPAPKARSSRSAAKGRDRQPVPEPMQGFGQRLKELRERRGLTQSELAARAGITQGQISHYERDERVEGIEASTVVRLAMGLGCSLDFLLAGRWNPELMPLFDAEDIEALRKLIREKASEPPQHPLR